MSNAHYWEDKDKRAEQAKEHTKKMARLYEVEINQSVKDTKLYTSNSIFLDLVSREHGVSVVLDDKDSVESILDNAEGKTCVLNFASYKYPGGGFIAGSKAQEECLCHESFLYNVLRTQRDYYEWNKKNLNRALYMDRALYSPNIIFERGSRKQLCDVLTCAAPNYTTAERYCGVAKKINDNVLRHRIRFIFKIAMENKVDTLILGAWGCGVFGQSPKTLVKIFNEEIENIQNVTKIKIYFSIPKSNVFKNFEVFKENLIIR